MLHSLLLSFCESLGYIRINPNDKSSEIFANHFSERDERSKVIPGQKLADTVVLEILQCLEKRDGVEVLSVTFWIQEEIYYWYVFYRDKK